MEQEEKNIDELITEQRERDDESVSVRQARREKQRTSLRRAILYIYPFMMSFSSFVFGHE